MVIIDQLKLRNFRSFGPHPIEIDFGRKMTVLIGPNNAGKSNILRALQIALQTPFNPFTYEGIACREDDFPVSTLLQERENLSKSKIMQGNIQIKYSASGSDKASMIDTLINVLYPLFFR